MVESGDGVATSAHAALLSSPERLEASCPRWASGALVDVFLMATEKGSSQRGVGGEGCGVQAT